MNIVDSSGWLEFFGNGPNASFFERPLDEPDALLVPTIAIYEVFKVVLNQRGESEALRAVSMMHEGKVIDLTTTIALHAARLSTDTKLPIVDSVMLASAREFHATLWTQDADFEGIEKVEYVSKS